MPLPTFFPLSLSSAAKLLGKYRDRDGGDRVREREKEQAKTAVRRLLPLDSLSILILTSRAKTRSVGSWARLGPFQTTYI